MTDPPVVLPCTLRGDPVVLFGHPEHPRSGMYPLGAVLGHGGFGAVYEAGALFVAKRQTAHRTHVPQDWAAAQAIYARVNVARVAQGLRHLNSAVLHGVDGTGATWVLLPRMDADIFKLNVAYMTPTWLHQIAIDALRGLAACHTADWSHCDVKLENILITFNEHILAAIDRVGGLLVQISDFGLAQRMDEAGRVSPHGYSYFTTPEATSAPMVDGRLLDGYALGLCIEHYFVCLVAYLAGFCPTSCLQLLRAVFIEDSAGFPGLLARMFESRHTVHAPTGRPWNAADWCGAYFTAPADASDVTASCLNASEAELRDWLEGAGLSNSHWQYLLRVQHIAQQLLVIDPKRRASPESLLVLLDNLEPEAGDQALQALLARECLLARQACQRISFSELILENLDFMR